MIAAEQKKVLQEKVILLQSDLDILNKRINEKDFTISDLKTQKVYDSSTKVIMLEQRSLLELDISGYKNQIKILKRKSRWLAIAGIVTSGLTLYLGTKF